MRELHVYGSEAGLGNDGEYQHQGFGKRLVQTAENRAREAGFEQLAIISGIGAREYYRQQLDYHKDGPYMMKQR